jgi:hypothetical protein
MLSLEALSNSKVGEKRCVGHSLLLHTHDIGETETKEDGKREMKKKRRKSVWWLWLG